jgi:hypothetical protein
MPVRGRESSVADAALGRSVAVSGGTLAGILVPLLLLLASVSILIVFVSRRKKEAVLEGSIPGEAEMKEGHYDADERLRYLEQEMLGKAIFSADNALSMADNLFGGILTMDPGAMEEGIYG